MIAFQPLTPSTWNDFELLFGKHGASYGCWCMFWLLKNSDFRHNQGDGNHDAMQNLVFRGEQSPGILAYVDQHPAGWVALAPRENYLRLANSRILSPLDDQPVWSIVCFFVARKFRRQGLNLQLIQEAICFAKDHGARIIEAYPVDNAGEKKVDSFVYTGLHSSFLKSGFVEVGRRSPTRPIMRYDIQ